MSSEYKHTRSCTLLRCVERLIYVGDNIVNLLDANGLEHTICVKEPLSKTDLSGLQAAGRLQGPVFGPESGGTAGIRGVSGGPRPCGGRLRPLWGACSPRQAARQGAARNRL